MTDQTPKLCLPTCGVPHSRGITHDPDCPNAAPVEKAGPDAMDWTYLALREENAALRADLAAYDTVISKLRAEVERLRGLEADYHRIVGELIPIAQPASGRPDDQLEPPWEVVAGLRAEVERLRSENDADRRREYGYSQQTVDAITKERDSLREENASLRAEVERLKRHVIWQASKFSMGTAPRQVEELEVFKALTLRHVAPVNYETVTTTGTIAAREKEKP